MEVAAKRSILKRSAGIYSSAEVHKKHPLVWGCFPVVYDGFSRPVGSVLVAGPIKLIAAQVGTGWRYRGSAIGRVKRDDDERCDAGIPFTDERGAWQQVEI